MLLRIVSVIVAAFVLAAGAAAQGGGGGAPGAVPCEFRTEGRVVVIGDVFANYDGLVDALRDAGLIDEGEKWIGGDAQLVQTGDILPRDRDWQALDLKGLEHERPARLLMRLGEEARSAGGGVHALMGWLEMLLLRWRVEPMDTGIFGAFVEDPEEAQRKVDELFERWEADRARFNAGLPEKQREGLKANFREWHQANMKPGCVEFFERYDPNTDIGAWMRSRNVVVKINDVIYAHVGISERDAGLLPNTTPKSLQEINDGMRALVADRSLDLPPMADLEGPILWRRMAHMDDGARQRIVDGVLSEHGGRALVVGIAPKPRVERRGNLFFVDSNLGSRSKDKVRNVLVIDGEGYEILEDGRAVDRGSLPPAPAARVIEGQPEGAQIPGGGVPRVDPPKPGG